MDPSSIEDYDEQIQSLIKKMDKHFQNYEGTNVADRKNLLTIIGKGLSNFRELLTFYKHELSRVPRQ